MSNIKLDAGSIIPKVSLEGIDGKNIEFGVPENGADWQMVVIYRGKHCPKCTQYLELLSPLKQEFLDIGIDIVVASADTKEKALEHVKTLSNFPYKVGANLSIKNMKDLGLYISDPRSEKETDRPFAEPAIFVINNEKKIHIVDISNAPFSRPDLSVLLGGLKFIRSNDYPIRGTHI